MSKTSMILVALWISDATRKNGNYLAAGMS